MSRYIVTFFTPILVGCGITYMLMRDEDKDLTVFKKEQLSSYKKYHENNEQIFKYIMDSTKGDKIVYFAKDGEDNQTTTTTTTTTPVTTTTAATSTTKTSPTTKQ
ncbi:hypothetical protein PPL_09297 [Heterostelium album PN500]|uniref:Lipoprotein n=1 Tax=Heterostelium pallidum (strain ATCC 26659 / Pp 5 / PN500) TaxID=670386 RepID=D3BL65_HETP5|nr:hypothetical protein PPL_09297 [Heterostelium album PN500]EFA77799.1 hypothetical protein PPL_09297 [Heterostelium album PN500]|eukprot:XP_020429927.1 hypothetical protein PPL_09297 [Heterostelium album PN500]